MYLFDISHHTSSLCFLYENYIFDYLRKIENSKNGENDFRIKPRRRLEGPLELKLHFPKQQKVKSKLYNKKKKQKNKTFKVLNSLLVLCLLFLVSIPRF